MFGDVTPGKMGSKRRMSDPGLVTDVLPHTAS